VSAPKRSTLLGLRRVLGDVRPLRRKLYLVVLLLLLHGLLRLPVPFLTMYIVDEVILQNRFGELLVFSGLIVLMSAVFIVADFLKSFFVFTTSRKLLAQIKLRLLEHIQRLPITFFNEKGTGYLMSRFLNDLSLLNSLVTEQLIGFLQSSLIFIIGLGAIFYIHTRLALMSVLILPAFLFLNLRHRKQLREMNTEVQERRAIENQSLHEILHGILVIKAYTREKQALIQLWQSIKASIRAEVQTFLSTYKVSSAISFLGALGPLVVLSYGGYEIMRGRLTLGELIAFNTVLAYLYQPGQALASMYVGAQRSLAAADRVLDLLDEQPESVQSGDLSIPKGDLRFVHVTFAYEPDNPALSDVSFKVPEGTMAGIVGGSGAGKSTLVNLLLRFHAPQAGKIYLGGRDLQELNLVALRSQIALVSQETFLFDASIRNNIRLGNPRASEDEIRRAAEAAHAARFIDELPLGLDTRVGRMGYQLSAGQRQRIALARAFLRAPTILILDEATSSVDSHSENLIWRAIASFNEGRTTFIISHRLSSLSLVDHIVYLDRGRVVASGSRAEIMKLEGFHDLYLDQTRRNVA